VHCSRKMEPQTLIRRGLGVLVTGVAFWTMFDKSVFSYHPVLMIAAFALLLPESIYQVRRKKTEDQVKVHSALQWLAFLLVGVAYTCIYMTKEEKGRPHLTTIHSWFGAGAFCLMLVQLMSGVVNTFFPQLVGRRVLPDASPYVWSNQWHRLFGLICQITALVALLLGIFSKFGYSALGGLLGVVVFAFAIIAIQVFVYAGNASK